jgi:hypothetical protein
VARKCVGRRPQHLSDASASALLKRARRAPASPMPLDKRVQNGLGRSDIGAPTGEECTQATAPMKGVRPQSSVRRGRQQQ